MNSTQFQLSPLVSTPPSTNPMTLPAPATAAQMPSALLRSAPSAKIVVTIERAAGASAAAPSPCTARAAISASIDVAMPPASEARPNTVKPPTNSLRRPNRSASRPPSRSSPPKARTYALTTQERSPVEA
jgi:hypothetical protein